MANLAKKRNRSIALLTFNENLVALNLDAPDAQTVIDTLAGKLYNQGLVVADYGRQTYERELMHPTGLPTKPFCIAFPHADAQGVNGSALALATLAKPVAFKNMGDPDEDLQVVLVLMLANRNPEEQVQTLRNLAILFGRPDKLSALRDQTTAENAVRWLGGELHLGEQSVQADQLSERRGS
jgi:PTS system galactitol-specific IIA component